MNDLVSIITPSYNSASYITDAVNSVLSQSYTNWEMIIVDDCSKDDSVQIIEDLVKNEKRIIFITLDENIGAAMARNKALEYAKGNYIAFLDSDDIWHKEKLEKQVAFMQENNYEISFTSYQIINSVGETQNHVIHTVKKLKLNDYLKNTIIGFSTSMIDLRKINFPIRFLNIRIRQDTNLWITLLKQGYCAYGLDECLVEYRVHKNSISANKIKAARQVWYLYYKIHKFGFFKSIYFFAFYAFNTIKKRLKG